MRRATKLRALTFLSTHVGTRRKAFPFGYRFDFTDPDPTKTRVPFKLSTLYALIAECLVTASGPVTLTPKGEAELRKLQKAEVAS